MLTTRVHRVRFAATAAAAVLTLAGCGNSEEPMDSEPMEEEMDDMDEEMDEEMDDTDEDG